MGNRERGYWREAAGPAWGDAWKFMRSHLKWGAITLAAGFLVYIFQLGLADLFPRRFPVPEINFWRDILEGIVITGVAMLLTWLWHLFIVLPPRVKKSLDERHQKDQSALAEASERHRVDLESTETRRLADKEAFEIEREHFEVTIAEAETQHQSNAKALRRLREAEARHLDALEKAEAQHLADKSALDAAETSYLALEATARRQAEQAALALAEATKALEDKLIPLSVELSIHHLSYAYPPKWPQLSINSGLPKREFAFLIVQNVGKRDAANIVAECKLATSGESLDCHWSKESNGKFVLGGSHDEGLKVWQKRVLLIAQVFSGEISAGGQNWYRLPSAASDIFPDPALGVSYLAEKNNKALMISPAGEPLDLDHRVEVIVNLYADGVNHSEHILLSFDWKGPTISRVPEEEGHPKG